MFILPALAALAATCCTVSAIPLETSSLGQVTATVQSPIIVPRSSADLYTQFDDLPPDTITGLDEGSPVGTEQSLSWPGFNYAPGSPPVAPYVAQSSPNVAFTDAVTRLEGSVTNGSVTAQFSASTIASFDLQQFYFGAALEDTTAATPAISVTIEVVGFSASDEPVAVQRFTSPTPSSPLDNPLVLAELGPEFANLRSASFSVVGLLGGTSEQLGLLPAAAAAATTLNIDSVSYVLNRVWRS